MGNFFGGCVAEGKPRMDANGREFWEELMIRLIGLAPKAHLHRSLGQSGAAAQVDAMS